MSETPYLSIADRSSGRCLVCGRSFAKGFAYLSGGALFLSAEGKESLHAERMQAFLHIGYHGKDPEMSDSVDVPIVVDLHGGQFDLQWCSVACMRMSLMQLLATVERSIDDQTLPGVS